MSDRQHIEALELDHKPGSVDMNAEQTGKFPFHAFEFDNPEETAPDITLISPWSFIIEEDLSVSGDLTVTGNGYLGGFLYGRGLVKAATADYVVTDTDHYSVITVSGTYTVTLPTAADNTGRIITVVNIGTTTVTVDGEGTEKIGAEGNALTFDLYAKGDRVRLVSNGTLWVVLDTNGPELLYTSDSDVTIGSALNTWYEITSHSLAVPAGKWEIGYVVGLAGNMTSTPDYILIRSKLDTATTGTENELATYDRMSSAMATMYYYVYPVNCIPVRRVIASTTTYKLCAYLNGAGGAYSAFSTAGSLVQTKIFARRIG